MQVMRIVRIVQMIAADSVTQSFNKPGNVPAVGHGMTGVDQSAHTLGQPQHQLRVFHLVKQYVLLQGIAHIFHRQDFVGRIKGDKYRFELQFLKWDFS